MSTDRTLGKGELFWTQGDITDLNYMRNSYEKKKRIGKYKPKRKPKQIKKKPSTPTRVSPRNKDKETNWENEDKKGNECRC